MNAERALELYNNAKDRANKWNKEHRARYNVTQRKFKEANKEKLKQYYREYHRKRRALAPAVPQKIQDPFEQPAGSLPLTDRDKQQLYRIASALKWCCKRTKTKNNNHELVTLKYNHRLIMESIGYKEEADFSVSRSWTNIPSKILGWPGIQKKSIIIEKIILFGLLVWKAEFPEAIAMNILRFIDPIADIKWRF